MSFGDYIKSIGRQSQKIDNNVAVLKEGQKTYEKPVSPPTRWAHFIAKLSDAGPFCKLGDLLGVRKDLQRYDDQMQFGFAYLNGFLRELNHTYGEKIVDLCVKEGHLDNGVLLTEREVKAVNAAAIRLSAKSFLGANTAAIDSFTESASVFGKKGLRQVYAEVRKAEGANRSSNESEDWWSTANLSAKLFIKTYIERNCQSLSGDGKKVLAQDELEAAAIAAISLERLIENTTEMSQESRETIFKKASAQESVEAMRRVIQGAIDTAVQASSASPQLSDHREGVGGGAVMEEASIPVSEELRTSVGSSVAATDAQDIELGLGESGRDSVTTSQKSVGRGLSEINGGLSDVSDNAHAIAVNRLAAAMRGNLQQENLAPALRKSAGSDEGNKGRGPDKEDENAAPLAKEPAPFANNPKGQSDGEREFESGTAIGSARTSGFQSSEGGLSGKAEDVDKYSDRDTIDSSGSTENRIPISGNKVGDLSDVSDNAHATAAKSPAAAIPSKVQQEELAEALRKSAVSDESDKGRGPDKEDENAATLPKEVLIPVRDHVQQAFDTIFPGGTSAISPVPWEQKLSADAVRFVTAYVTGDAIDVTGQKAKTGNEELIERANFVMTWYQQVSALPSITLPALDALLAKAAAQTDAGKLVDAARSALLDSYVSTLLDSHNKESVFAGAVAKVAQSYPRQKSISSSVLEHLARNMKDIVLGASENLHGTLNCLPELDAIFAALPGFLTTKIGEALEGHYTARANIKGQNIQLSQKGILNVMAEAYRLDSEQVGAIIGFSQSVEENINGLAGALKNGNSENAVSILKHWFEKFESYMEICSDAVTAYSDGARFSDSGTKINLMKTFFEFSVEMPWRVEKKTAYSELTGRNGLKLRKVLASLSPMADGCLSVYKNLCSALTTQEGVKKATDNVLSGPQFSEAELQALTIAVKKLLSTEKAVQE